MDHEDQNIKKKSGEPTISILQKEKNQVFSQDRPYLPKLISRLVSPLCNTM